MNSSFNVPKVRTCRHAGVSASALKAAPGAGAAVNLCGASWQLALAWALNLFVMFVAAFWMVSLILGGATSRQERLEKAAKMKRTLALEYAAQKRFTKMDKLDIKA